ncbi:DMT family transporter [Streptomyces roseus]|uniref:Membrane protein n=1 Tax=Streptomyces roseus TaxID=66430 RepID=A0A0J6XQ75_9ACTN|nr:DMT family transporter [Streptomyces roseus]KMO96908.1 membrane protein [Streptomyces roseus]
MTGAAAVPAVVLASAVLHATWNGLTHGLRDKLAGFTLISLASAGCGAVLVCLAPLPDPRAWPYLACSAALQVAYQLLLLRSYQLGDFGQMYPTARGTSPVVVAVVSATFLGHSLPVGQAVGIGVVSCGLAALAFADGIPGRAQLPALAAAVGTGMMIASYTLVDGSGVRVSGSVLGYIAWLFLCQGLVLPVIAWARRGPDLLAALRPLYGRGLAGGLLSLLAYGLVVWAQSRGDLATIAALRETSIVFGALIGAVVFRERLGHRRIAASAAVLAGIAVLQFTGGA